MSDFVPNWKRGSAPISKVVQAGRLKASERKHERKKGREKDKKENNRVEAAIFAARREAAFRRDRGRCRAFGVVLKLVSDDPLKVASPWEIAHPHHQQFRSAGGSDDVSNLITLSPKAHDLVHAHRLDVEGDPDGLLVWTLKNPETGEVLQRWESVAGERIVGAPKVAA